MGEITETPMVGASPRSWSRRVMACVVALAAGWGAWLLWEARQIGFHYLGDILALGGLLLGWALLELVWGLVLIARRVESPAPRHERLPGRRWLVAWFAAVALLVVVKAPVMANVLVSRSALEAQIAAVQAGRAVDRPTTVGGFDADRIAPTVEGCRGPTCEVGFIMDVDSSGPSALVWTRDPENRLRMSAANGHLFGPWYWAIED